MVLIKNHQRKRRINTRLLRWMTRRLMQEHLNIEEFEISVHIVNEREMTRLNEEYLQHEGSTDVITFDYGTLGPQGPLVGDIFVCVDEARIQADRFRTSWESELTRYVVHGALHLLGHDDHDPARRKVMKRHENRLLKLLDSEFKVSKLSGTGAQKLPKMTDPL